MDVQGLNNNKSHQQERVAKIRQFHKFLPEVHEGLKLCCCPIHQTHKILLLFSAAPQLMHSTQLGAVLFRSETICLLLSS